MKIDKMLDFTGKTPKQVQVMVRMAAAELKVDATTLYNELTIAGKAFIQVRSLLGQKTIVTFQITKKFNIEPVQLTGHVIGRIHITTPNNQGCSAVGSILYSHTFMDTEFAEAKFKVLCAITRDEVK